MTRHPERPSLIDAAALILAFIAHLPGWAWHLLRERNAK